MFENIKNYARGHKAGLITEGHTFPETSVQDCNNLDFMELYDRRRPPYRQISVSGTTNISEVIGEDFYIIGFYEKDFSDADGNIETVIILVAKNSINFSVKIFTNKFYHPDSTYGNSNENSAGWINEWTDITESYFLTDTSYNWSYNVSHLSPLRNEYVIFGSGTKPECFAGKPDQHYKGWFIYDDNICIGQITSFTNVANVYTILVAMNSITYREASTLYDGVTTSYSKNIKKISTITVGATTTITSNGHGFSNGDAVKIYGILGSLNVQTANTGTYIISGVTANTFVINHNSTAGSHTANSGLAVKNETLERIYLVRYPFLNFFDSTILDGRTLTFPEDTITAITKAANGIITTTNLHAFNAGDTVYISGVTGMTEINGMNGTVVSAIGNSVTISINTSGFSTYTSGGTIRKYIPEVQFVEQANIEDAFNSIKICIGNKIRPIRLTFLQGKRFWNPNSSQHNVSWNGFWLRYDIPLISNIDKVQKWETAADTDKIFLFDNTNIVENERIGRETGVRLKMATKPSIISTVDIDDQYKDTVIGMCITLDGYQTIFYKYFIGTKYITASPSPDSHYMYAMSPAYQFFIDFDRSLTDTNTFAHSPVTTPAIAVGGSYKEIESFMLISDVGGITELSEATNNHDNLFEIDIHTEATSTLYARRNILYSAYIDVNAIGIPLGSVINSKFYHSPVSAFSIVFKVGENIIGADIGEDFLGTDSKLRDKYGYSKIVISALQFRDIDGTPVNADSCFGEERIRQLISGERITAGQSTVNNRFLLFTDKSLYSYQITDEAKGGIDEVFSKFLLLGTYSQKSVVRAKIGDQFAGVYWIAKGQDSIYRMLDNRPEDILNNRWRESFRELSDTDKANAVTGFNSKTRDVYFVIGTKIYVWNLERENWQIYTFADRPEICLTDSTGQIIFTSGKNIFRLEPYDTEYFKDETTDGEVAIPFKLTKEINYGTEIAEKIFDRINIEFEKELDDAVAENPIRIKAGQDGSEVNLLDETISINPITQFHRSNKLLRSPAAQHRIEIIYSDSTGGIKKFELKELLISSKSTARRLSP